MFMLIIWLQGIWLPLHGYDFASPRCGPASPCSPSRRIPHRRTDLGDPVGPLRRPAVRHRRHGGHGASVPACSSSCRSTSRTGRSRLLLFLTGLTMASFGSPNRAGVMNSLPAEHRGAGSGMNTTFQNSAQVLSIGIFFTLMIVGLSSSLAVNPPTTDSPPTVCRPTLPPGSPTSRPSPHCSPPSWATTPCSTWSEPTAGAAPPCPTARPHRPQLLPRTH